MNLPIYPLVSHFLLQEIRLHQVAGAAAALQGGVQQPLPQVPGPPFSPPQVHRELQAQVQEATGRAERNAQRQQAVRPATGQGHRRVQQDHTGMSEFI